MTKLFYLAAVLLITSSALLATSVPEIDATSGSSAVALLLGGLVVLRGRRKK